MGLNYKILMLSVLLHSLRWWSLASNLTIGLPFIRPPHTHVFTTDVSLGGWGGHLKKIGMIQGPLFADDFLLKEQQLHINLLELRAIRKVLEICETQITGQLFLIECDNQSAVAYVNNKGGTRLHTLSLETQRLYEWTLPRQIIILVVHCPGIDNILADFLPTNRVDPTEQSLHKSVIAKIFQLWGKPQIDLFVSESNHQLPLWFSCYQSDIATAFNALVQQWKGWNVYAFSSDFSGQSDSNQDQKRVSLGGNCSGSRLAKTTMVPTSSSDIM